ncbi:MAG: Bax inhibitor-1/YccA family protein [Alphaproteobacteria bacterium]|nr:Bax inhibitor-1/YccA family protein [Alphaproteobacteria bacterium]
MADNNIPAYQTRPVAGTYDQAIDQGLRTYMLSVYQYMMLGLGVTGLIAYFTSVTPALFNAIYGTPLMWVVMFAPLGIAWFAFGRIDRMSASTAQMWFWAFAAIMGLSMASIFKIYVGEDIVRVFFITSATFGALSLYGYTTPRSLSAWGSFLIMGVVGLLIASVVNIFMQSSALSFAISAIGVLVFAGLTAYDTQQIKEMYSGSDDSETMSKKAIVGALRLYMDFINLFIMLLRLLGNRE